MPTLLGPQKWSGSRDKDGYREFHLISLVQCEATEGPFTILNMEGLPQEGDIWEFDDDSDEWCWCTPIATITPRLDKEPNTVFEVDQTFSSKPLQNCFEDKIEDPILIPPKISGSFTKYTEEARDDVFGKPITNSAHEQIRGHQVEFDKNRLSIKIEMNVPDLDLDMIDNFVDTLNDAPIWGFQERCVKLSSVSWERKFYGTCDIYFTLNFEFETRKETFDRTLLDEGTKMLNGHWDATTGEYQLDNIAGNPPDETNPAHFIKAVDRRNNPVKLVLNGHGVPAEVMVSSIPEDVRQSYYIAVVANNGVDPVTDAEQATWMIQTSGDQRWDADTQYSIGNLVVRDMGPDIGEWLFIAIDDNKNVQPPNANAWIILNTTGDGLTDQGIWDATVAYVKGDRVWIDPNSDPTFSGSIFVAKYQERDFTELGVPVSLTTV